MKVCLVFPEGEFFQRALDAVRDALQSNDIVQIWPKLPGGNENTEQLTECDLLIADVTGRNPQVMYYLGWADALKKRTMLLAWHAEDFPFSKDRHPIVYARDPLLLQEELEKRLQGGVAKEAANTADAREKFYTIFGDLLKKHGADHRGGIEMENEKTFVLTDQDLDLALVQDMARRGRELGLRIKLL